RELAQLPVPTSRPPEGLLEQILHGPDPGRLIRPPFRLRANPDATREYARQKLALAFALAASLVVFAVGWWAWPPAPVPTGPTAAQLAYHDLRVKELRQARTPDEEVTGLIDLAGKLLDQTQKRQDEASHRTWMADHFDCWSEDLLKVVERKAL